MISRLFRKIFKIKVYCSDCVHYGGDNKCADHYKKDPIKKETVYVDCTTNKNNDCKYYDSKESYM